MKPPPGDRIILAANRLDEPTMDGDVLEFGGDDGEPPHLVRWTEGYLGLLYPGPRSVPWVEADTPVPEIGDEVGAARLRRHLAHQLLAAPRRTSTH